MKNTIVVVLLCLSFNILKAENQIGQTGNVGIRTTNPQNVLHVNGGITSTNVGFISTATPSVNLFYDVTNDKGFLYSLQPTIAWKALVFGALSFSFMSFGINQGLFQDQFGNVGIGTKNPLSSLHVNGNISLAAAACPANTYLQFQRVVDGYTGARIGNAYDMVGYTGDLVFETNHGGGSSDLVESMRITSNGSVGIGTDRYQRI